MSKVENIFEFLTFIGTVMSFEALILWQLFKLSKGYKLLMSSYDKEETEKNLLLKEVRRIRYILEGGEY
ncbi:MAG: hypothetical protein O4805_09390 [Trichodesmium sp. St16_bin2-tuft]|jgi:hypothetical protein|nr:hypothetical protein [Trichodesmium sp. St18_bin1]MDE5087344.1 hypothetical protein [Trichodesmium sp. St16_bin2-tuft]MDE5116023.1 hypothetical protein [Trichodesmium sp. St2_bin2_1]